MRVVNTPVASSPTTVFNGVEPIFTIAGGDMIEELRQLGEICPVVRFPGGGIMVASGEAAEFAMHHPQEISSNPDAVFLGSTEGLIPIQKDPPEHTRYRKMLDPLF